MIEINKGRSPGELIRYKNDPNSTYANLLGEDKEKIKLSLVCEQGYLCAYCMKRIDLETSTIEHFKPQNPSESESDRLNGLDYNNMLAVCSGNRGAEYKNQTCDAHKGNSLITVNPLNKTTVDKVRYRRNGEIYSDDEQINEDLNVTLNLNCEAVSLPENRKAALVALQERINRACKNGKSRNTECKKIISANSGTAKKLPYWGIIKWQIEKWGIKV